MKKHELLIYDQLSHRTRRRLLFLAAIMGVLILYDQFTEVLGDFWYLLSVAFLFVMLLWVYYAFFARRASLKIKTRHLRLQGPILGLNISYGRIHSVTPAQLEQHFPQENLKKSQLKLLKPFYGQTCIFIELNSYPKSFRWRNLWFPRFLFGTNRPGLVCCVADWMALSRDIESARAIRHDSLGHIRGEKTNTLASQIIAEGAEH